MFGRSGHPYPLVSVKSTLDRLGLSSVLCLDAGDLASYDGTSQQWSDVSGSANHFNRGTTSGADATDPTFSGTAGALSANEYFSFDGGDFMNPVGSFTAADTFHRDGASFTAACIIWLASVGSNKCWLGNALNATAEGFRLFINTTGTCQWIPQNGTVAQTFNSALTLNVGAWNYLGLKISENGGATASRWNVNGNILTFNANMTTPGTGAPSAVAQIGGRGGTTLTQGLTSGDRIAAMVISNSLWSDAQQDAFREALRPRFSAI